MASLDESTQARLFAAVVQDPEVIRAAAAYSATCKALRVMAPELDNLTLELDSCVGRYITAHLFAGFEVGRQEVAS